MAQVSELSLDRLFLLYRTPDRIFRNLARRQETGDRRQETTHPSPLPRPWRGRRKREDMGKNNTQNSTHQHQDFRSKLMREKT
ncbi:MAG: hypothetical protein F6K48_00585 [Okeania sp. SIO3H1]|nr:hypothetical protein [Okeania sp. SIO3H1]